MEIGPTKNGELHGNCVVLLNEIAEIDKRWDLIEDTKKNQPGKMGMYCRYVEM